MSHPFVSYCLRGLSLVIDWFPIKLSFAVASAATLIALVAGISARLATCAQKFSGTQPDRFADYAAPRVAADGTRLLPSFCCWGHAPPLGGFLYHRLGIRLTFTVTAAIIAATIHALPLVTKSLRAAFESVNLELEAAARTLGLNSRLIFFRVTMPLAARGVLAATALAFARALGDFGVTIMIAGNIPGRTQTASVANLRRRAGRTRQRSVHPRGDRFADRRGDALHHQSLWKTAVVGVKSTEYRVPSKRQEVQSTTFRLLLRW